MMLDHVCQPFEIQAPHGAAGVIDVAVDTRQIVWIEQYIDTFIPRWVVQLRAELTIDDAVVAQSLPATIETVKSSPAEHPGVVQRLLFKFPPMTMLPQYVGVRYRAVAADGTVHNVSMKSADAQRD